MSDYMKIVRALQQAGVQHAQRRAHYAEAVVKALPGREELAAQLRRVEDLEQEYRTGHHLGCDEGTCTECIADDIARALSGDLVDVEVSQ